MVLPHFIVLEGIDGSGTSTQIELLKQDFEKSSVFFTAEPTDSKIGTFIRSILSGDITTHPYSRAYLFAADRAEHLYGKDGILEQFSKNKLCICDRYLFSSIAYQGMECGMALPKRLNKDFPLPTLLFYFKIDPDRALERIAKREKVEIYEKKSLLEKIAKAYDKTIASYRKLPNSTMKIIDIDATLPIQKIHDLLLNEIKKLPTIDM